MSRGTAIKEIEEFPRRLKIFFWVIVSLLVIGTTGFWAMTRVDFGDAFFRTIQTFAFMFAEESSLPERSLEIFLAVVGLFLVWWVLWSIADMLLDGNLRRYLKTKVYSLKLKNMDNHIIVVGGGRVGEEVARIVYKKKQLLVIESDLNVASSLRKKGYLVVEGDASNEEVLKQAGIEKASKLVLTLPKTETNIMITLSAKELNREIEIYSRCEKNSLVSKLKKAGAKVVIVPEILAADEIAKSLSL